MISLPPLSLRESIAVAIYKTRHENRYAMQSNYSLIARWLDVFNYIEPKHQTLIEGALYLPAKRPEDLLANHQFTVVLQYYNTESEQTNICRYIKCQHWFHS